MFGPGIFPKKCRYCGALKTTQKNMKVKRVYTQYLAEKKEKTYKFCRSTIYLPKYQIA